MKKLISIITITAITMTSCSTTKGYNYKKHYKKQNIKNKVTQLFDIDNCKKNNHAYKY